MKWQRVLLAVIMIMSWLQGKDFPVADALAQGHSQGDELLLPFVGEKKALLIRVIYPDDARGLFNEVQVRTRARSIDEALWRNSYGKVSLRIDITPELIMPQPKSYYFKLPPLEALARLRGDAVMAAQREGYNIESYDREIIYSRKSWNRATGMGTINFSSFKTTPIRSIRRRPFVFHYPSVSM